MICRLIEFDPAGASGQKDSGSLGAAELCVCRDSLCRACRGPKSLFGETRQKLSCRESGVPACWTPRGGRRLEGFCAQWSSLLVPSSSGKASGKETPGQTSLGGARLGS